MNYFGFPESVTHALTHADDLVSASLQTANEQDALVDFNAICIPVTPVAEQVDVLLLRRIKANADKGIVQRFRREPAMLPRPPATKGSPRGTLADKDKTVFFVATHDG